MKHLKKFEDKNYDQDEANQYLARLHSVESSFDKVIEDMKYLSEHGENWSNNMTDEKQVDAYIEMIEPLEKRLEDKMRELLRCWRQTYHLETIDELINQIDLG